MRCSVVVEGIIDGSSSLLAATDQIGCGKKVVGHGLGDSHQESWNEL